MIKTAIICFTNKGLNISQIIKNQAVDSLYLFEQYAKYEGFTSEENESVNPVHENLFDWTLNMQKKKYALVFIGATGIAVRAIAAGLENKLNDAPVIVIDELGQNVIPLVGGHIGGANEMATYIADCIGARPVITTATDLEESFSVDLFAKENNLSIHNKDGIAKVSSKALEGKTIRLSIENYPPSEDKPEVIISANKTLKDSCDILLCPRSFAVGIGCKKGSSFENLKEFYLKTLSSNNIDPDEVGAIGSIDLKADEEGLLELCRYYKLPFITYTSELLLKAKGEYKESDFVKEKTGIGNVCERAAMLLTGNRGTIVLNKQSENGMTIAIAKMR